MAELLSHVDALGLYYLECIGKVLKCFRGVRFAQVLGM